MVSASGLIEALSEREIEHLSSSPTMREAFLEEMADEHGLNADDLMKAFLSITTIKEPVEEVAIPMKVVAKKPVWDDGNNFTTKQKKAKLMNECLDLLQHSGYSKTEMLKILNKDNVSWRKLATEVLDYMVARGMIIQVARKYYINNNQTFRETSFHRKVYSALCEGPQSTSAILRKTGYNNPKGRDKLFQVLSIMRNEDLIVKDGKYWSLAV